MKKVIFIASTLNTGGAQKVLSNIVMKLPEEYHAVIVLNDAQNIVYPYKGEIVDLGFRPKENKMSLWYQGMVFIKRIMALRKLKRTGEYVAAVSFLDSANVANILSGKKYCRTIVSVHNNLTESASSRIYKYLVNPMVRVLYGKADKVVTVSKGIEYDLIHNLKLSPENIVTIYNGHDIDKIREMSEKPIPEKCQSWFEGKGPFLVTMGRMNYQKGQWHLIRALSYVKNKFPDIKLIILGDGELREYLENLIQEYRIQENVILGGFVENPFCILQNCDVYVFPSLFEGFPNALIEALSVGLPCISADFRSGAREILAPKLPIEKQTENKILYEQYGILVPVCDGKLNHDKKLINGEIYLAEAIIQLLSQNDLQKRYKQKTEQAVCQWTSANMVNKWLEIIG